MSNICSDLKNSFKRNLLPQSKCKMFFKRLQNLYHKSFKKVRIRNKCTKENRQGGSLDKLFLERNKLKDVLKENANIEMNKDVKNKLNIVETHIYDQISTTNAEKLKKQLCILDNLDGSFSQLGLWKVKSKLFPRPVDPPTAKKDEQGNLITSHCELKSLYLRTYKARLDHRIMKEQYRELEALKDELWELRLWKLKSSDFNPWSMEELRVISKELKNNQCRDPNSLISEIFKEGVIGNDLKVAILDMMNMILETFHIPDELLKADISSIWKRKGSKMELSNDRGIFILSIFRKILDKLLYHRLYPSIEKGMSNSNIGARKHKNVRNHLFIIYGIVNSVLKDSRSCIDIQIYDLVQAFDALWLKDCMNDIYDILPPTDRGRGLALVYELNRNNLVAVNTPVGITERVNIPDIVQQGGGWGPIQCSVSIDKIGRDCENFDIHRYKYKGKIKVCPLSMVDDLLAVASCGLESLAVNTFINTHIELKKLAFHTPDSNNKTKCHKIHVGKPNKFCPNLKVHGTTMPEVDNDEYLGDIISADGKNKLNIKNRVAKGYGKIAEIMGILEKLSFGKHYYKIAILLRDTLLLGSILTNSEVWYRLTNDDLNELEKIDRTLLKRICILPSSTPSAALYLELGCMRVSTIIKARRLNYLHYLAKLNKSDMLYKFFWCQWLSEQKDDWVNVVRKDLKDFGICLELNQIEKYSSQRWKLYIKKSARKYEFRELLAVKDSKNKTKKLVYENLEMQDYLKCFEKDLSQVLLRYRMSMSNFSGNFKNGEKIKSCPLCSSHEDIQDLSF